MFRILKKTNILRRIPGLCLQIPKYNFCAFSNKGNSQSMEFKTETKRLLEIVAHSLYTDKDVFIRELLSNASDALEKQRFMQESGRDVHPGDSLQIMIQLDADKKQIIITDTGIGMSREDLINNLGTIAGSGSKKFVETLKDESNNTQTAENIIGQFGVGFYSSFIVGDTIQVISKSANQDKASLWVSDGTGEFEISDIENPGFERGTKIIINLKPNCLQFSKKDEVLKVIQRYSNFLNFPIYINGDPANLVKAIWTKSKRDVTEDEYTKFYEYFTGQKVQYRYKLHYQTDVPLSLKALIYIPSMHMEKFGMQMEDMHINLYSRKILIKSNCRDLLPQYLRFVKGVVDCEDLPLNISRENYQDSSLILKLKNILTKRVLKAIAEEAEKDEAQYLQWYNDFQYFLKEGLASEPENQDALLQLIRYHSNFTDKFINIEEYVKQMSPKQDSIYFILAGTRDQALASAYYEPFKNTKVPVLIINMHVDEMVFRSLQTYKGKYKFVNVETSYEDIQKDLNVAENETNGLPQDDITPFCLWIKNELSPIVSKVQISKRLTDSPAIVVGQLSSGLRQVMGMIDKNNVEQMDKNLTFEINPNHEIIKKLNEMRKIDLSIASVVIRQILDNTMLAAGLTTDLKSVVNRVNKLILHVFDSHSKENNNLKLDQVAYREEQLEDVISQMENDKDFQEELRNQEKEEIVIENKKTE